MAHRTESKLLASGHPPPFASCAFLERRCTLQGGMDVIAYQLGDRTLYEITGLPDRRLPNAPPERWLFTRHCEEALYGGAGTGAFVKLLARCAPRPSSLHA